MIYQLTSCKEVIARLENDFDVDKADWISRAPLWIADALEKLQLINAYEDKKITLNVEDYILQLPDDAPQDIRRILAVEYNGLPLRRLNTVNPIKQPNEWLSGYSTDTYSIKNGYIVTSFEEGEVILYYQTQVLEYDVNSMIYFPKVPMDSVIQGAIEWYLIYCMLRRGHKHPIYSLDSKNPITNPYSMWISESKAARNKASASDPEERMIESKLMRTFLINYNKPLEEDFRQEDNSSVSDTITGQVGIA